MRSFLPQLLISAGASLRTFAHAQVPAIVVNPPREQTRSVLGCEGSPIWLFSDWSDDEQMDTTAYIQSLERRSSPAAEPTGPQLVRIGEVVRFGNVQVGFTDLNSYALIGDRFNFRENITQTIPPHADLIISCRTLEVTTSSNRVVTRLATRPTLMNVRHAA